MQKLRAFTLMELLIGMIISSIVISFCYMSYELIHKQYLNYKTVKKELVEVLQLNSVMNADVGKADRVLFFDNKLELISEGAEKLEYDFVETVILRKSGSAIDTFKLSTVNLVPNYLNNNRAEGGLLISLSFDAMVLGELEYFQFVKRYDAETVIKDELRNFETD